MTGEISQDPGLDEGRSLFSTLMRRAWIPLLCGLLVGGLAYTVLNSFDKSYQACSYLKVNSGPVDDFILGLPSSNKPITNIIGENAAEIEQFRVAERAVEQLQLKPFVGPLDLLDRYESKPDQNSGLIELCAKGRTPREGQRIANAVGRAYVEIRRERELRNIRSARRKLQKRQKIRVAQFRLDKGQGATGPESIRASQDQIERLQVAETVTSTDAVEIAKPALLPEGPAGIPPWALGLLGLVIGSGLGFAILAVREQSDRRLRTIRQLERALGAPVLASIATPRSLTERHRLDALTRQDIEPFRLLFARLRNSATADELRSLVIASVDADGSSGSVAWYLGAIAASSGARVVVLETDHERPSAVDSDTARPPGVTNVLAGHYELSGVVFHVAADDSHVVDIVSPGSTEGAGHLADNQAVRNLLAAGTDEYGLVLIDTPPVIDADAVPFVRQAQGVVLVYRCGGADREAVRDARDQLASVGTPLLGIVAVGFRR